MLTFSVRGSERNVLLSCPPATTLLTLQAEATLASLLVPTVLNQDFSNRMELPPSDFPLLTTLTSDSESLEERSHVTVHVHAEAEADSYMVLDSESIGWWASYRSLRNIETQFEVN